MQKKNIVIIEDDQRIIDVFKELAAARGDITIISLNPIYPIRMPLQIARRELNGILLETTVSVALLGNRLGPELNGQSLVCVLRDRNIPFFSYSSFDSVHDEYQELGAVGKIQKILISEITQDLFQSEAKKLFEYALAH
jgi:hypothetical protein